MTTTLVRDTEMRTLMDALGEAAVTYYAAELVEQLKRDSRVRTGQLRAGYYWVSETPRSAIVGNWVPYAPYVHGRYGNVYGEEPFTSAAQQVDSNR